MSVDQIIHYINQEDKKGTWWGNRWVEEVDGGVGEWGDRWQRPRQRNTAKYFQGQPDSNSHRLANGTTSGQESGFQPETTVFLPDFRPPGQLNPLPGQLRHRFEAG